SQGRLRPDLAQGLAAVLLRHVQVQKDQHRARRGGRVGVTAAAVEGGEQFLAIVGEAEVGTYLGFVERALAHRPADGGGGGHQDGERGGWGCHAGFASCYEKERQRRLVIANGYRFILPPSLFVSRAA